MGRHQPREAGPDTRNTGGGGGGNNRRLSRGYPRPAPSGPLPGSARGQGHPSAGKNPQAPFHRSQAGEPCVPSPGAPQTRAAR